ncbi:hypothetical protein V2J09_004761 [Rumex salicifolius]
MSSGGGTSTFVIKWINFFTMLIGLCVVGFAIWLSSHGDGCRKSLTLPVLGFGATILVISLIGFLGAQKKNTVLLWINLSLDFLLKYLILLCFILIAILIFTVLAFIVTNNGSGHKVSGLRPPWLLLIRYKEYQLEDYSTWFLRELNNSHNWMHLRACLVNSQNCGNLSKKYKNLRQYKNAKLTPIEAGCCRPPSECGYPAVNASYYDLSYHPASSNKDCKLYKNKRFIKCYDCDSCKAGVAQYMKTEWRVVAIFNVALFIILSMVYFVGCCARRDAMSIDSKF